MIEAMLWTMAEPLLATQLGAAPRPRGNGSDRYIPHGAYRCAGEDDWLSLAVTSEERMAPALRDGPGAGADGGVRASPSGWSGAPDRRRRSPPGSRPQAAATAAAELRRAGIPAAALAERDRSRRQRSPARARLLGRAPRRRSARPAVARQLWPRRPAPRPVSAPTPTRSCAACSASPATRSPRCADRGRSDRAEPEADRDLAAAELLGGVFERDRERLGAGPAMLGDVEQHAFGAEEFLLEIAGLVPVLTLVDVVPAPRLSSFSANSSTSSTSTPKWCRPR